MMTRILQPYLNKFVVVYLDDILIYSKTEEEHLKHIEIILDVIKQNKLYANKEKCNSSKQRLNSLATLWAMVPLKWTPLSCDVVSTRLQGHGHGLR